jgi:hypothetical protein
MLMRMAKKREEEKEIYNTDKSKWQVLILQIITTTKNR